MDLKAVYKKTQKGLEEMAQRTVLGMRERTLLVMVDGKTTAADLLARAHHMPDPQGLLAKLIEGGFIAADASAAVAPAAAAASAPAAAAPQDQRIMQDTMRYAEHFLDEVLGPQADVLAEAIGKCKTMPELRTRLEKTRDAIAGMGKKRRAEEFWANVEARLEGRPPPAPATPAAPPAPAVPPAPAASPAPPPPAKPATAAQPQPSAQEAVRFARRFVLDALGPQGDALVEAIEKCRTLPELRLALGKCRDALQVGAGKRKAEEFWSGVEQRLPEA
jgi:hypothetical protein